MDLSTPLPSISLYCTEGGSNKEYHAKIITKGDGYVVQYRHGKIGSNLTVGEKPELPVSLEEATKEFESIVKSKKKKYTEDTTGKLSASTDAAAAGQHTGLLPQLLVTVSEKSELQTYIDNPEYGFQEKHDGWRVMLKRPATGEIISSNKSGIGLSTLPQGIADDLLALPVKSVTLDGELVGGKYFVFDVLEIDGVSYTDKPYEERYEAYVNLGLTGSISPVLLHKGTVAKTVLLDEIAGRNGEGIVGKLLSAPYSVGRAAGTQFKYVFKERSSFVVLKQNGKKRSVLLGLINDTGEVLGKDRKVAPDIVKALFPNLPDTANGVIYLGNLTIPQNAEFPQDGAILEVEYRHRFVLGALCQPVFKFARNDVRVEECVLTQIRRIKVKSDSDTEEE